MQHRTVIPHLDDLGASHGANQAFFELAAAGYVTCGAVIVPGPWFRELADAGPRYDLGVHLTLTSEWRACRWAPLSTVSRASGLIDDDGYFWPDLASLRRHVVAEAAEAEMRAQIERAIAAGLAPTHVDSHMAAAMLPGLLPIQIRLAEEYGLVPILPRAITWAPDPEDYARNLQQSAVPRIDHCRGTLAVDPADLAAGWDAMLDALPPGLTHLALHATIPGDFAAAAPDHAVWRAAEYEYLRSGQLAAACRARDIAISSTRALNPRPETATPR